MQKQKAELPDNNDSIPRLELRKYANRRYYDTTRTCHVTLEQIHGLIQRGHDVRVTESKSGQDITAKVLAQIILDHEPTRLGVFPVELLHKLIRANEQLVNDFVDKYFNRALMAFMESQKHFETYMRDALGLRGQWPAGGEWMRAMMGPFYNAISPASDGGQTPEPPTVGTSDAAEAPQLRDQVEALSRQVTRLEAQLDREKKEDPSRSR